MLSIQHKDTVSPARTLTLPASFSAAGSRA